VIDRQWLISTHWFCWVAGSVVQLYKGAEGSIRSIACHTTEPLIAACGLDRFLRIYDISSRQLVHKVRLLLPLKLFKILFKVAVLWFILPCSN